MRSILYSLSILVILFSSCADENAVCDVTIQTLQGQIYGNSWTAGEGRAKTVTIDGSEHLDVVIFTAGATVGNVCTANATDVKRVLFTIPKEIGNRPLKLDLNDNDGSQTVTMFDPDSNLGNDLSTNGCAEIVTLTASQVTMAIKATTPNSDINGNVTLTLCD